MSDHGIKISKDGNDVKSADDFNLLINSQYPNLTVFESSSVNVTTTASINVSLDYVPIFMVWFKGSGDTKYIPVPNSGSWHSVSHHLECWFDNNTKNLELRTRCDGSGTDTFKYIIFYERLDQ